jgi:hypothetical protein
MLRQLVHFLIKLTDRLLNGVPTTRLNDYVLGLFSGGSGFLCLQFQRFGKTPHFRQRGGIHDIRALCYPGVVWCRGGKL